MTTTTAVRIPSTASLTKWMPRAGWVITALMGALLLYSAALKLTGQPMIAEVMVGKLGYPSNSIVGIGILELCCVVLYAIPRTTVLGAVLLTGYLGAAVATHLRVGDPFTLVLVIGGLVWLGVFLRDQRVRALLPLRAA